MGIRSPGWILGTANFSGVYGVLESTVFKSDQGPEALIRYAERAGFVAIDTASSYRGVEKIIGTVGTSLNVHTKLDPSVTPRASIARSMGALSSDFLELVYFHVPDVLANNDDLMIKSVSSLKGRLFEKLGVSIYDEMNLVLALGHPDIDVIQLPVNPMSGALLEQIELRSDHGKRIIGRSILGQGLLLSDPDSLPRRVSHLAELVRAFQYVCRDMGLTPLAALAAWLQSKEELADVIVAGADVAQVNELLRAFGATSASDQLLCALDEFGTAENLALFDPRRW